MKPKRNPAGRWYVDFGDRKNRQRKWFPASYTQEQAELAAREFAALRAAAGDVVPVKPISQAFARYIAAVTPILRPGTIENYRLTLRMFADWLAPQGILTAEEVTPDHARALMLAMHARNLKPGAIRAKFSYLRPAFSWLQAEGVVTANPFTGLRLPRAEPKPARMFTPEQTANMLERLRASDDELYKVVGLLYYAFIRPGEAARMTWADVDLHARQITVPGHASKNRRRATVQVGRKLAEILAPRRPAMLSSPLVAYPSYTAGKRHRLVLRAAGLEEQGYSLYSWKHTGAARAYIASGRDLLLVSRMLRHSNIDMTQTYLRQLDLTADAQALDW